MSKMTSACLRYMPPPTEPFRFSGPVGRRYGLEIAGIFAIKLPLLLLLWFVAIRPSTPAPDAAINSVARMYGYSQMAKP